MGYAWINIEFASQYIRYHSPTSVGKSGTGIRGITWQAIDTLKITFFSACNVNMIFGRKHSN